MSIAEGVTQLKQDFDDVYDAGKKAERDAFWDVLQAKGTPTRYYWRFSYPSWKDSNYNPKYDIVGVDANNALGNTFYTSSITDTKVAIDATRVPSGLDATFYWAKSLKRIRKLVITENTTFKQSFTDCSALISIDEIEGAIGQNGFNVQWSANLTHDSLMSIINALADKTADTSGTEWVVTIGETNKAKLTADELAVADAKGWEVK